MWLAMCGNCGKEYGEYECKDGSLCRHCFDRLPESVQKRCGYFTKRELHRLNRQLAEPEIWGRIGALGIGKDMISIGGKGIRLKNVKRIGLNFHPLKAGGRPGTVMGAVTVAAELRHPHIMIEEPLSREYMTVSYRISGREIAYRYSRWLESFVEMLQECLKKRICDMTPYKEKVCALIRGYDREKAEEEIRAGEEKRRRAEETRKRAEQARKKAHEEQADKAARACGGESLQRARKLFQVENRYTRDELKERRRRLLKKYHPDAGGSEEMAKRINMAYDLLNQYAAS